jgi:hypothetical protein
MTRFSRAQARKGGLGKFAPFSFLLDHQFNKSSSSPSFHVASMYMRESKAFSSERVCAF